MSSFEKDFPSLKEKKVDRDCEQCALEYGGVIDYEPIWAVEIEDIQEHCIDKQRVKEAIEKVHPYCICNIISKLKYDEPCFKCSLLKSLGLEGEKK